MSLKQTRWTLPSEDVRVAWQHQVVEAAGNPELVAALAERGNELWPRFAAYYARLRVLPRRLRRALRRKLPVSLAGAALMLALGQGEALAAVITVDGAPCTLINAIEAANTDTATGGCTAGSGADTLDLQTNVTLTAVNNTTYGNNGLPLVTSKITIAGNGYTIARDGSATDFFRLLAVAPAGELTLNNVTISGGWIKGKDGGSVYNSGTLTIAESTVSGNSSNRSGGGMSNIGTLTIINSTLSGNSAQNGGGVHNYGEFMIVNSTVSGNRATSGYGGGVDNTDTATITNSTVSGNSAVYGGGVYNGDTLTLNGSLISGNTASVGAELYNRDSVSANSYNLFGHDGLTNAQAFYGFAPGASDINATSSGTNTLLTNILDTALADNGGPTRTHALVSGSPAINSIPLDGGGTGCLTQDSGGNPISEDQRVYQRPAGAYCDVGAFEFGAKPVPPSCALLGDLAVNLGNGAVIRQGAGSATVCSNGEITTGFNIRVLDGGQVQQSYNSGLADGRVEFGNGVQVSGDVRANGDLVIATNSIFDGDIQAGLDLIFRSSKNTVTGECTYGGLMIDNGVFNSVGSESIDPIPPFAAAFPLPTCSVTAPGGIDISTNFNETFGALPPGDYGQVNFRNGTTLELCGEYSFKSLTFGANTKIEISCPSIFQVEQQLTFHNGVKQTLTGGTGAQDIVYLVQYDMAAVDEAQRGGFNTELYGTICGPKATIDLGDGTDFEGAIYAKSVNIGANVQFTASPAPLP